MDDSYKHNDRELQKHKLITRKFLSQRNCHGLCVGALCLCFVFLILSLGDVVDTPGYLSQATSTTAAGHQSTLFTLVVNLVTTSPSFRGMTCPFSLPDLIKILCSHCPLLFVCLRVLPESRPNRNYCSIWASYWSKTYKRSCY